MANISSTGHAPELTLSGALALLVRRWWILAALTLLGGMFAWLYAGTGSESAASEVTLSVKTDHVRATWRQELERQVGVLRSSAFREQVTDATTTAGVSFEDFEIQRVDAGELLVLRATAKDGTSAERAAGIAAGLAIDRSAEDITGQLNEEIAIIESRIGLLQPSIDELNLSLIELSGQEAELQRQIAAVNSVAPVDDEEAATDDVALTRLTAQRNQIFDEQDLRRRERNSLADQQAQFRRRIDEIGLDLALGAATVIAVRGPSTAEVTSLNRSRFAVLGALAGMLGGVATVAALDHRRRGAAVEADRQETHSASDQARRDHTSIDSRPAVGGSLPPLVGGSPEIHRAGAYATSAVGANGDARTGLAGSTVPHTMGSASDTDVEDFDIGLETDLDIDLDEIQQGFTAEPWLARRSVVIPDQATDE